MLVLGPLFIPFEFCSLIPENISLTHYDKSLFAIVYLICLLKGGETYKIDNGCIRPKLLSIWCGSARVFGWDVGFYTKNGLSDSYYTTFGWLSFPHLLLIAQGFLFFTYTDKVLSFFSSTGLSTTIILQQINWYIPRGRGWPNDTWIHRRGYSAVPEGALCTNWLWERKDIWMGQEGEIVTFSKVIYFVWYFTGCK